MDELKAGSDAVMVGIGTVLSDDPSLTVKNPSRREMRVARGQPENPMRIVVDSMARTPLEADIFRKGEGPRVIAVSESAPAGRVEALREKAEVIVTGKEKVDLPLLLEELYGLGVRRIMVEGGATLNYSLIKEGLVDELYVFVGNLVIGGECAPTLVDGEGLVEADLCRLDLIDCERSEEGVLLRWRFRH